MLGVDALDPHPGLVRGHRIRLAQAAQDRGLLRLERRLRPPEHVPQRPLADRQAENIREHRLQPLVGDVLDVLQIKCQRLDVRPEGRARCRRRCFRHDTAGSTGASQALMARDHRQNRRQINAVMGPDHLARRIGCEHVPTTRAAIRSVFDHMIGVLRQRAEMAIVAGLRAARLRRRALFLAIRRWWSR